MNEQVAYAYRPQNPSVLRSLKRITDAARRAGKEISVCGEMTHDPDPQHLTELQQRVRSVSLRDAEA